MSNYKAPPRMATWLLRHFGPTYGRESLLGDLFEEYQAERTRSWYWRQVMAAIWIARTHPLRLPWAPRVAISTLLRVAIEIATLGAATLTWANTDSPTPQRLVEPTHWSERGK